MSHGDTSASGCPVRIVKKRRGFPLGKRTSCPIIKSGLLVRVLYDHDVKLFNCSLIVAATLILSGCASGEIPVDGPKNPSFGVAVDEPVQLYIAASDIDPGYEAEYREVMANLNAFVGGYSGFNTYIFSTWDNSSAIIEDLNRFTPAYRSVDSFDDLEQNCLSSVGNGLNKFGICLNEQDWYFYVGKDPAGLTKESARYDTYTGVAHEYFHWFQDNMAGQKHLDYQGSPSVSAPTWWVEGTASLFSFLWIEENAPSFSIFQQGVPEDYQRRTDPEVRRMDATYFINRCPEHDLSTGERYDTETECTPNYEIAIAHLASLSSYQAVFVDIPRDFRQMDFEEAFQKNIGISTTDFYRQHKGWLISTSIQGGEVAFAEIFPKEKFSSLVKFPNY